MNRKFITIPATFTMTIGGLFGTAGVANAATPNTNISSSTQGFSDHYVYGHPTVRVGQACPYIYATGVINTYQWYRTGDTRTTCSYRALDYETGWYRYTSWSKR